MVDRLDVSKGKDLKRIKNWSVIQTSKNDLHCDTDRYRQDERFTLM